MRATSRRTNNGPQSSNAKTQHRTLRVMKLSAYIITVDSGFSPNPFGRHCTLACCKPTIRRKAERGDVVIAIASAKYTHEGKLVYAMKVKEVITLQKYWRDARFGYKKPTSGA